LNFGVVVLDTNVFIRHGFAEHVDRGPLSAVVLQEITAGAADAHEVRDLGLLARDLDRQRNLLVPTGEDWYYAGKVLNSLLRGLPSMRGPRTVAIDRGEQQRLLRDVLIARSAKRANAVVVTYNLGDFEKIRRFCNVRVEEPARVL
jgi:predicted nucleic acid-binding protein